MGKLKWKYISLLKDDTELENIEIMYHFPIPSDLKECIKRYNAGVPSLTTYDIGTDKEKIFGGLLSYNKGDMDSFFDYVSIFEKSDKNSLNMFPFGLDPAGNFFCIENNKVVLYCHETDKTVVIAATFTEFLHMLY